ncbi:MAG: IS1380 family transposase [Deltaproteobacteria bacterium]|nr:IS1380 family transposase [Deltaproteobacteria bacterium]
MKQIRFKSKCKISKVGVTEDTLTGRGGLALFVRYVSQVNIYALLLDAFGHIRRSEKGQPIWNVFKQIFCFFYDGTSRHLVYFDQLKRDRGYASVIENTSEEMIGSHQVKRFFKAFSWLCGGIFRRILKRLFIWRLKIQRPDKIELTIDLMIMDNDEALKRHGVEPTYKKVKGFGSLQVLWNRKVVDAIFRGGSKHSNAGQTVVNMVTDLVNLIRREYRADVPIVVRMDSGFFDEDNLAALDRQNIGVICTGKVYDHVKGYVGALPENGWAIYDNGHQEWEYVEFGYRYESWKKYYRAIYTRPAYEGEQRVLDFARPDNIIITNLGVNPAVVKGCSAEVRKELIRVESIIHSHHQRGADELPHRGLKDFGFEELPFKRFSPNTAFFYCMLISFFLFETFKEDVLEEVLPVASYATTVRRKVVDFAAKIITTSRGIILKVTQAVMDHLRFDKLWERCQNPIPILG